MKIPSGGWDETSALAAIQAPQVEVRSNGGSLLAKVDRLSAATILIRGWGEPVGNRYLKYLRLTPKAPLRAIFDCGWLRGSVTTQAERADETCNYFSDGQLLGDRQSHQAHKPVSHKDAALFGATGISPEQKAAERQEMLRRIAKAYGPC